MDWLPEWWPVIAAAVVVIAAWADTRIKVRVLERDHRSDISRLQTLIDNDISGRRAFSGLAETVTRIDERQRGLTEDLQEIKQDLRQLNSRGPA